jgi:ankyrin repeat protein
MNKIVNAIEDNDILKLKVALKDNPNLNFSVEIGEEEEVELLFFAIRKRVSVDMIKMLIEHGANIDYINDSGVGILDEAAIYGDIELLSYLIDDLGMDINSTKRGSGLTPFIQSCCYGKVEVAKFMLSRGADLFATDNMGLSAKDYARKLGHKKMREFLEEMEKK